MGSEPLRLPTLEEFLTEELERKKRARADRFTFDAAALRQQALGPALDFVASVLEAHLADPHMRPEDFDKLLSKDPAFVVELLANSNYPVAVREKVLEVALLRGGTYPLEKLGISASGDISIVATGVPLSAEAARAALQYQTMAVSFATTDRALFEQLSNSGDWVNQRQPATQLMHIMLQEGGHYPNHNHVEDWILDLPPELRGRAMYHLYDAGASKDIAGGVKLDSGYLELGAGPITAGASFKYEDTHWRRIVTDIDGKVVTEVSKSGETDAYNQGWRDATKRSSGAQAGP